MAHALHHSRKQQQHHTQFNLPKDENTWVTVILFAFGLGLAGYALLGMEHPTAPPRGTDPAHISYD